MFKVGRSGRSVSRDFNLAAPVGGLDAVSPIMGMRPDRALVLENWFPMPSGLVLREGSLDHVPGFASPVYKLHVHANSDGAESIWATTDSGIYDVTTELSAPPTLSIALTEGKTVSTSIATGAGNYLMVVNGVDTLKRYDGTTWTSVATFGTTDSYEYIHATTYRQRLFFAKRDSLELEYLAPNSIAGSATNYPLGALFRNGGRIVSIGTWTIDGGFGPEDNLVVITSKGEVAVFSGSDPSSASTWTTKGVYALPRPMGNDCLFKWGGDVLVITEAGVYPLSSAVQSTSIDRTQQVSENIKPTFTALAKRWEEQYGWQIVANPAAPYILVNIPSSPRRQAVMNTQTGAWTFFRGWAANCFVRAKGRLFFGTANGVFRVGGTSDLGANIRAKVLQAYNPFQHRQNKKIDLARPYFSANGGLRYWMGIGSNFATAKELTDVRAFGEFDVARWGIAIFGEAQWAGQQQISDDWQTVPDEFSLWKALYMETVSKDSAVTYIGSDFTYTVGGNF
jgi:hypothetical protein